MQAKPRPNQTFDLLLSLSLALAVLAFYLMATPIYIEVHGAMNLPLWPSTALLFQHYKSLAFVPLIGWALSWRIHCHALKLSIILSMGMLVFMIGAANFSTAHGWPHSVERSQ